MARAKVDKLAQVVNDFRDALIREIELIDKAATRGKGE
jgi:hypothetical protein